MSLPVRVAHPVPAPSSGRSAPPGRRVPDHPEFVNDIWDVRRIEGVRYGDHLSDHLVNFTAVPDPFVLDAKLYLWFVLTGQGRGHGSCRMKLRYLRLFLQFFVSRYPQARDLRHLSTGDITDYKQHLQSELNRQGRPRSESDVRKAVVSIEQFVRYLQRTESPVAPVQIVDRIIWPEHLGNQPRADSRGLKYIPEEVLIQLDRHIGEIRSAYLPVVLVLRASGWRISDVLNLRWDSCLERTKTGSFLYGDIQKVRLLGHKIPVTAEVAAVIQTQIEYVKAHHPEENNPKRYLFPSLWRQRAGRPLLAKAVSNALNRLAGACEIRGPDGQIWRFKTHAFRHTKAVELINNGMPLIYVQQWLAHLSPEMTQTYARLLDDTMRRRWEETMGKVVVRLGAAGAAETIDPDVLIDEDTLELGHIRHNLEGCRLPNGWCFKPRSMECPASRIPCLTCSAFATTSDFLPQFEHEVRQTEDAIAVAEQVGHERMAEANHRKLIPLLAITDTLRQGELHQPLPKYRREYTPAELAQRAQQQQEQSP